MEHLQKWRNWHTRTAQTRMMADTLWVQIPPSALKLKQECRNWNTGKTKNLVVETPCGFDPHLLHYKEVNNHEYTNNRYGSDRTKYQESAQGCRLISEGFTGHFWLWDTSGYLQVGERHGIAHHRQSGSACGRPADLPGRDPGNCHTRSDKESRLKTACNKVPWSKGQDTGLSSRRYWVQVPWGSLRLLSLKVRTPASQAGDVGFKSRRSYCGHR